MAKLSSKQKSRDTEALLAGRAEVGRVVAQDGLIDWDDEDAVAE